MVKKVVYSAAARGETGPLWLAPLDRSSPAKRIGDSSQTRPHFGPRGQILFQAKVGNFNYLEQMNPDGSGRSKVVPYPIIAILGISPGTPVGNGRCPVPGGHWSPADGGFPWRVELRGSSAQITVVRFGPRTESIS